MDQRARGQASNEDVESAVSSILAKMGGVPVAKGTPTTTTTTSSTAQKSTSKASLQVDQGNYDEEDDDDEQEVKFSQRNHCRATRTLVLPKIPLHQYQELLEAIPMGRVGAQMMTAFGDGPQPNPEALKAALDGTRQALQFIVMDARALRRRVRAQYSQAQQEALAGQKKLGTNLPITDHTQASDPAMIYRALLTDQSKLHDPLGRQPPCGFDVEQLSWLYPEELRAYDRWSELHAAYEQPAEEEDASVGPQQQQQQQDDEENEGDYLGGHFRERAAVFDVRTDQMPQEKYMKFSKVRQGSFLPRGLGKQRSKLEKEWEGLEVGKGRGKKGSWLHMPAITVRFLHWLGFEPPEVPPPDNETTQVLAFLGHDRMGRIVEKAIYMRNLKRGKDSLELREVPPGEQLTLKDIQTVLEDPDIKPAALFPLEDKGGEHLPNVQLYFGPGFEQRLELEMDEYVPFIE